MYTGRKNREIRVILTKKTRAAFAAFTNAKNQLVNLQKNEDKDNETFKSLTKVRLERMAQAFKIIERRVGRVAAKEFVESLG